MSDLAELLAPPRPDAVAQALEGYSSLVAAAYGDRLVGLHLFGSRSRGDNRPGSDADIAVVLAGFDGSALDEKMRLVDLGFDALTDAGLMIQPWPFTEGEWLASEPRGRFGGLLTAARRDARPLTSIR